MGKANKKISKNEFRYNHSTGHPNFVFEEDGNKYHSLGLTHHKRTYYYKQKRWLKNMPLYDNPEKNKTEKSYVRYGIITNKKKQYGNVTTDFRFSNKDKSNIKSKIRNYKNHRRKQ